jgi:adenylate kinase
VIDMIRNKLEANLGAKGFIFDGFPRTKAQAVALDELLQIKGAPVKVMLSLEVPEEELVKRLLGRGASSGRTDDKDENIIRRRIQEYEEKTAPLKEHYKAQGKYKKIEGIGEVSEITQKLVDAIGPAGKVNA